MSNATSVQQPADQVANLMKEMADEAGIEINLQMPSALQAESRVRATEQVRFYS
jgi:hypothetical protein